MTYTDIFKEAEVLKNNNKKIKDLEDKIKEAREINKLHQELNGKLRKELDLEKKNHAITREDVQAKDLELGRMMEKMTQKDS